MWIPDILLPPVAAFVLCVAATPLVRRIAVRRNWVARPSEERWHRNTTALMGGIAIYIGASLPLLFLADFHSFLRLLPQGRGPAQPPDAVAALWGGMTLVFILGLLDDFINIKPHTKLIGQIIVASTIAFLGFRLNWFVSLTADTMVTIFWIVGITNSFNLLDNMDGLCAGIGLIAALTLAALFSNVSPVLMTASLALAGAMGAFLVYNFKPASIFMGDSGSLLIGFSVALLSLVYAEHHAVNRLSAVGVPVFVMLVPIFDTTLVTFIRILSGRKASRGGKDHTSHRLVLMGLSEKGAVLGLYGIGAVSGVAAVFTSRSDTFTSPTVMIPAALAVLLMGIYLAQLRIYPEKEFSVLRDKAYTPILLEVTYKRQILLVLMDLCLIAFSYYLSYRLRFEGKEFVSFFKLFLRSLPAVIVCKCLVFFVIGVYRGIWRYMSTNDVYTYLKASTIASFLCMAAASVLLRGRDFPMGIFVIDWFLTTGFLLGTRGSFRLFQDIIRRKSLRGERILIYGAGRGGEILLKEILNNRLLNLAPVGFIDDDELKVGKRLQGYPVMGTSRDLEKLLADTGATSIIISFTARSAERVERVRRLCRLRGVGVRRFSICLEELCGP